MPDDLLDRPLDRLVGRPDLDAAWQRTTRRARRRRTSRVGAATLMAAVALVAGFAVSVHDDGAELETRVVTQPPSADETAGWTRLPDLPGPPRTEPAMVEMDAGRLFVWGGTSAGETVPDLLDGAVFDPGTRTWTPLPPVPEGVGIEEHRWGSAHALWAGGRVIVLPADGGPVTPLVWDPATDAWTVGAAATDACPVGPNRPAWTGEELVLSCNNGVFDAYDPAANTWRRLPQPASAFPEADLVWTGEQLWAVGYGAAEPYDPATDAWGEPRSVPTALNAAATDVVWTGEQVLVLNYDLQAEAFDPATGATFDLLPAPFPFFECQPELAMVGGRAVAGNCNGTAVLGGDSRWSPIGGPASEPGTEPITDFTVVGGAQQAYTTVGLGELWSYRAPREGDRGAVPVADVIPLGMSTYHSPESAQIADVRAIDDASGLRTIIATVLLDGAPCTASATDVPEGEGPIESDEEVRIHTADGWRDDVAVLRAPDDVTVAWRWTDQPQSQRNEATCPTLDAAVQVAAGFDSPA
jgi:hypothetical protein